jgi:hypothetical protein
LLAHWLRRRGGMELGELIAAGTSAR